MGLKTMVQAVRRYQATDGKEFTDRHEAAKYQAKLDLADSHLPPAWLADGRAGVGGGHFFL